MVTSHDVARLAGVSQPTVSRALRNAPNISEQTRMRVLAAAKTLGYVPNATGRALSRGRSDRVGLLITDITNRFYPHVIAPIHRQLTELGLELVLLTDSDDHTGIADRIRGHDLCGVILATTTLDSIVGVRLRDREIPFVYFNRFSTTADADTVSADPVAGIYEMANRLVALGHRRIGAVHGPTNVSTGLFRANAVRDALASRGVQPPHGFEIPGDFEFAHGWDGARQLLALPEPPTAIVCGNDVIAEGVLNAIAEAGVQVPGQISVAGFDDLPESSWPMLSLSTVHYDLDAMARRAAELLAARIEDPEAPFVHEHFPTRFVERRSVGPVPA